MLSDELTPAVFNGLKDIGILTNEEDLVFQDERKEAYARRINQNQTFSDCLYTS